MSCSFRPCAKGGVPLPDDDDRILDVDGFLAGFGAPQVQDSVVCEPLHRRGDRPVVAIAIRAIHNGGKLVARRHRRGTGLRRSVFAAPRTTCIRLRYLLPFMPMPRLQRRRDQAAEVGTDLLVDLGRRIGQGRSGGQSQAAQGGGGQKQPQGGMPGHQRYSLSRTGRFSRETCCSTCCSRPMEGLKPARAESI